ncbi:hypothetical protein [Mycoplasma suis]|uniref:Uncharacterized protein n=1 Tax=Mycoplasma suis (strain Illinois) TaxID=768700 RepID=F0QQH4_MYCSL|nr:hypothetical protein [Mycoplasma suis]ADX97744.1 hypothetical protein MSU_0200 [Mycoplasma suis str. Illinois]
MILKGLGGYGWTLIAGVGSALGLGGYGVTKFLGNSEEDGISPFSWRETKTVKNSAIKNAEYIIQKDVNNLEDTCRKWTNGNFVVMEQWECKKIVQEKWGQGKSKQPKEWFRSDSESITEVLYEYFSGNNDSITRDKFTSDNWEIGQLTCQKLTVDSQVEVSCSLKEEGTQEELQN